MALECHQQVLILKLVLVISDVHVTLIALQYPKEQTEKMFVVVIKLLSLTDKMLEVSDISFVDFACIGLFVDAEIVYIKSNRLPIIC